MDLERRAESLKAKLRVAADRKLKPFGWEAHRFELLSPVTQEELLLFESHHGVALPPEYRAFISTVGRGGAGPAYGLAAFENAFPIDAFRRPPFLSTAFPFEEEFLPAPDPDETPDQEDERKLQEVSGTLRLCDEGCGYVHLLVCSGPARGQMWLDSTVIDGPYTPLNAGFFDWYERWIDDVLAGGSGTWWLRLASDADPEFRRAVQNVKPWWRLW